MLDKPTSYCAYVQTLDADNVHRIYHDTQYGFPIQNDDELFGRLVLEINQAGLSWNTILQKQKNFQKAYHKFAIKKVASYSDADRARLLADQGIIRNRLKVDAAIHNASMILGLQKDYGSFKRWLDMHKGKTREEWTKLFKSTFKFTGGEIVNEFLMSTGYLPGAHVSGCKIGEKLN
jgi:DNA-3-methyladenine glycosylase I